MNTPKTLEHLTPPELLTFLRHLELGEEHLKQILTKEEFQQLLTLESLDSKTAQKLDADRTELTGKFIPTLHSIFTTLVGLWLGLSGLLGWSLGSRERLFFVVTFAGLTGALIGYSNYRFTQKLGRSALNKRKLQSLQMDVLTLLEKDRKQEIAEKKGSVEPLSIETEETVSLPALKKLITKKEDRIYKPSWFKSNLTNFFLSFIPTFFGGFGSMFLYISAPTQLAEEFGNKDLYLALTNPTLKKIELISAILITLYFAYQSLYLNYKSFLRNREFEEMEERLIRKKNHLHKLDDELLKIKEALMQGATP